MKTQITLDTLEMTCRYFSQCERIPVILLCQNAVAAAYPHFNFRMNNQYEFLSDFDTSEGPLAIAETKGHILFGWLWVTELPSYSLLIGPVKTSQTTDTDYIKLLPNPDTISAEEAPILNSLIHGSPVWSYQQLCDKLVFLNYTINGLSSEGFSLRPSHAASFSHTVYSQQEQDAFHHHEYGVLHNNYRYERELVRCITLGDSQKLRQLVQRDLPYITKPKYSLDEIRTLKDDFIITVTLVSRAAINGGLDMETALHVCDNYILMAEQCLSMEQIHKLTETMLADYVHRTSSLQLPPDTPALVLDCVNYINAHVTTALTTASIAAHFSKRREYLSTLFKQHTGYTISEFILRQRIENAKALLRYTKIPLIQISFHLCFSDQSHFQRVFKKHTGMTPMEYRRQHS